MPSLPVPYSFTNTPPSPPSTVPPALTHATSGDSMNCCTLSLLVVMAPSFSLALSFPAAGLVRAAFSSAVTPTCLFHQLELNLLAPCKLATGDVSLFYFSTASSLCLSYSRLVSEELQLILHLSTLEPSASEVVTAFKIRKNS